MKKNVISRIIAVALAIVLCLSFAGCSDMMQLMEMMQGEDIEQLQEGESIYSLSLFDSLPSDFSKADPLFWVAEGENGGKVYLLGSIHVADDRAYRIPENIMNAFLDSDALAVECDIVAAETDLAGQLKLMQYYMYTDGSKISDHVSPELYEAMIEFYENNPSEQLTSLGYTAQTLQQCKPSMWTSAFDTIYIEKAGLDSNLGIDHHFLMLSKSMGKKIIEVESVEFQASMFDSFSDDLNELLLSDYVMNDVDEYVDLYKDSYEAWLEGDPEEFYAEAETEYPDDMTEEEIAEYEELLTQYNDAMLNDRNVGMADTAEKMLQKGMNVFYVVGAAHMGGPTGVVTQLRERGWTVKQLGGKDADAYTTPGKIVPATTTATTTTAAPTTTTKPSANNGGQLSGNLDNYYDEYVALYEYFGGTTRPTTKPTEEATEKTEKTTRTTKPTSSDDSAWNNWGSKLGK